MILFYSWSQDETTKGRIELIYFSSQFEKGYTDERILDCAYCIWSHSSSNKYKYIWAEILSWDTWRVTSGIRTLTHIISISHTDQRTETRASRARNSEWMGGRGARACIASTKTTLFWRCPFFVDGWRWYGVDDWRWWLLVRRRTTASSMQMIKKSTTEANGCFLVHRSKPPEFGKIPCLCSGWRRKSFPSTHFWGSLGALRRQ